MAVSTRLVEAIKRWEGFDEQAYWDAYGRCWTIGWGRTQGVEGGDVTTPEVEEEWLLGFLAELQQKVRQSLQVPITEHQEEALISFAYNLGLGALRSSTLLRRLNSGDHEGAAREFDRWINAGGTVLNGLITRRAEERRWFEGVEV